MLYNIQGFQITKEDVSAVPEGGTTVAQHYKNEVRRLGIRDRIELDHIAVAPRKGSTDVSASESVTVDLAYITRGLNDDGSINDSTNTDEARDFEIEIEDPSGNTTTQTFQPTNGEAAFTFTPDTTGVWTVRSVAQTENYVDEFATVEGI